MIEEQFALNEIKQTSYDRKNETLKSMSPIYDLAMREITEKADRCSQKRGYTLFGTNAFVNVYRYAYGRN